MTDRADPEDVLFADPRFLPKKPKSRSKNPKDYCAEIGTRSQAWDVLHQLSHSRTAFTEGQLSDLTGVGMDTCARLCDEALAKKWVKPPQLTVVEEGRGRMWVGRL